MVLVPLPQLIAALQVGFTFADANRFLLQCQDAVQTRRFFCSELSEAGPVIHGTSSPDQSPL